LGTVIVLKLLFLTGAFFCAIYFALLYKIKK
jgi:hypothetical protein